jgi:deoxycytidine triphosphate deaminase
MTLLAGSALDPKRFFVSGNPPVQGSSFDLTVGCIVDHEGKQVQGPFTIKPGHMVQIISAEELKLSDRVTGHVTYKTTMTRQGIWALTVGIVDPGWNGPVATTLLNFSRVDHSIAEGDPFLRVSLFEHEPVPADKLRKSPLPGEYVKDIKKIAASRFPMTFLDTTNIAEAAGRTVLTQIRTEALGWVAGIAILITIIQIALNLAGATFNGSKQATVAEIETLRRSKIEVIQSKLLQYEARGTAPIIPSSREPTSPNSSPALPGPVLEVTPHQTSK